MNQDVHKHQDQPKDFAELIGVVFPVPILNLPRFEEPRSPRYAYEFRSPRPEGWAED